MFMILKHAEEVIDTFRKLAVLELEKALLEQRLQSMENQLHISKGRVAGLEIERDQLEREVAHWQTEFTRIRDSHGFYKSDKNSES